MGSEDDTCRILQLSDCTMMCILSYLDATSLFNLSRTCHYFKNIVEDPKLWRYIEARHEPNSTKKVQFVCDQIHEKTTHILLRAESNYEGLLPQSTLVGWIHLKHLTILALENQRFNGKSLTLQNFPNTLEELSLKKTYVKNGKQFFHSSFMTMWKLRVLILDECNWIDSNFFMSVAKYENLEILSIVKCMRLHLNVIPYLNVARHGCKKLKVIDCRFNTVANEILFQSHTSLVALYFQSMSSYQLDTGHILVKCPPMTVENQELILQSTIRNRSLDQYKYVIGDIVTELPHSVLYKDPYPECTCGWNGKMVDEPSSRLNFCEVTLEEEPRTMPVDDYIDFNLSPQKFICRKHLNELNGLPKYFKNFFYENQKKFYLDPSDSDSESEDDSDCCMFGVGKSQQMIILKVREADDQGNIPAPEVIDIFRPEADNNIIVDGLNIDAAHHDDLEGEPRNVPPDPQPSTSRERNASETGRDASKRKAGTEPEGPECKKQAINNPQDNSDRDETSSASRSRSPSDAPGPSRPRVHQVNNHDNAGPSGVNLPPTIRIKSRWLNRPEELHGFIDGLGNDDPPENQEKIKLRRLSLRGYREITNEGLAYIKNLNLDLLDVTHTRVTKEGIERFLTLNPHCRVVHPNYCVCAPRIPC